MNKWQPIETAPKDGTKVLLLFPQQDDLIISGLFDKFEEGDFETGYITWSQWAVDHDFFMIEDLETDSPAFWMPLPQPPMIDNINLSK